MFGMSDPGGLGGMHGASIFDDDGDMGGTSPFSSFRTTSGRMPGGMDDTGGVRYTRTQSQSQSQSQSPPKTGAPEVTRPLKLSLEDIYGGTAKDLKVSRQKLHFSLEPSPLN